MCRNCGCLANTLVNELTEEHDAVVVLIRSAAEREAAGRVSHLAACRQITAMLTAHTIVDEEGLFPELADEFPEHLAVLIDEHPRAEQVLGEAALGVPTDPGWPARVQATLSLLRDRPEVIFDAHT